MLKNDNRLLIFQIKHYSFIHTQKSKTKAKKGEKRGKNKTKGYIKIEYN